MYYIAVIIGAILGACIGIIIMGMLASRKIEKLEYLIHHAEMQQSDFPFGQKLQEQHWEKSPEEIMGNLEYRTRQYWAIYAILTKYRKGDEDLTDTVVRVLEMLWTRSI